MRYRWMLLFISMFTLLPSPGRAMELLMFEQAGCVYCARWNAEIAPAYPKTAEGQAAPLRRVNLHAPLPPDLHLARPVSFTPTFVLVVDGRESGRIEGYPGDEFFWGLLAELTTRAGKTPPE